MRRRAGYTLWETALVLGILGVAVVLTAPALVNFGQGRVESEAEGLLVVLRNARRAAIETGTVAVLRMDPVSGKFRVDTTGVAGMGTLASGELDLSGATTLLTDQDRLQFLFEPNGASFADSVGVRGPGGTMMVKVDPWTGVPRAEPR